MPTARRDSFDDDESDDRPTWREPDEENTVPLSDRDDPLPGDRDNELDDEPTFEACPYCSKLIHEDADICQHCHSFVHFGDVDARRPWWVWTGLGLALLGALTAAGLCATFWYLK